MAANAAPQSGYYQHYHHHHEAPSVTHHQVEHKQVEEHHEEEHYDHHPQYKFQYKVEDKKHHDFHGHQEHRDKDQTVGEYWLIEPDGHHKRIVKYRVDKKSGFVAHVYREPVKHY